MLVAILQTMLEFVLNLQLAFIVICTLLVVVYIADGAMKINIVRNKVEENE